jgi:aryl-alcohol dehydrogenase-like predicted oxidoreductase
MRYRPFGRTGLQVCVIGQGGWPVTATEQSRATGPSRRSIARSIAA